MPKQQRIRDPLHDLVEFDVGRSQLEDVLWRVIQTRPFQRLRRIKQLGFSDFVYPGATHSRLLHSMGVFHTARRLMKVIEKYIPAKDAQVDQALAAALVHDLGHGPFSHAFEKIGERFDLKMANHEAVSDILIRDGEVFDVLGEVEHSVAETRLKPVQTFVLGRKAIFAAEAYVLGLFQLYPTVYFHKATRGAEKIYTELLSRAITIIKDGSVEKTGLPTTHPLVKFAKTPDDIECALALDDTVIWGALSLMADSSDAWISQFAERMRDRKLYKCIDVRAKIAHDKDDGAASSSEADTVCAGIRDEIVKCLDEWSAKYPDAPPRILIDEVERSPYKELTEETKGPLNQINIRTEGDHLVDLSKRSNVVAELKTYKAFRVYHADGDDEAKRKITEITDAGISKWPA